MTPTFPALPWPLLRGVSPIYVVLVLLGSRRGRAALAGSGNANISQMRGWVRTAQRVCVISAIKKKKKRLGNHWLLFLLNIHSCDGIRMQNCSDVTVCFAGDVIRLKSP